MIIEEEVVALRRDINNLRCAVRLAVELVGRCRACGNRTQVMASKEELGKIMGVVDE